MEEAEKNYTGIVEKTYDEIAYMFSAMLDENNGAKEEIEAVDEFLSFLKDKENCRIADLGCGVGKHGRYCAKKGFSVTGLDISKKMIELANTYNQNENYATIDLLRIDDMCTFETNEIYDGVISFYAFIHLTYKQAKDALENIKKYLKEDAVIAISVYKGTRNGLGPEPIPGKRLKNYFRDYQEEEFRKLFDETGFEVISLREWSDTDDISAADEDWDSGVLFAIAKQKQGGK